MRRTESVDVSIQRRAAARPPGLGGGAYGDVVSRSPRPAYAACAWALVFLVPHVYWAVGGTTGLGDESMEGALAVVNFAAIVLSGMAAVLALAIVRPWGASVPRRVLLVGAWGACVALSLRGVVGVMQAGAVAGGVSDEDVPTVSLFFEPLFLIGGVLFGLAARSLTLRGPEPRFG